MKIVLARESLDERHDDLIRLAPHAQWVTIDNDGSTHGDPAGCEILYWGAGIFGNPPRVTAVLERWGDPALQWVQGPAAGVDHKIWKDLIDRGVRLTNASGIWAEPMAQYVNAWVLAWAQGLGGLILRSEHHEWTPMVADDLTARTMGIIGYGGIGRACARIAKGIGMRVIATRRTPGHEPDLDELMPPDRLHELLAAADYVVLAAPLTDETRDMIGAAEFAAMGSGTVFINVARGEIVDEEALATALRNGTIRGATTDVTRNEPLPPESPLWDVPNLIITPHQSGEGPRAQERLDDLFLDNLGRYMRGETLINEVTDTGVTH